MINICVIGGGRWGKNHIKTLYNSGKLGGIIEANPNTQKQLQKDYPNTPIFNNLSDPGALDFQAYTVVVPAEHHYSVGKTLLENKKHVLIEKPITLNAKDAENLVKIAAENQAQLMVGHLLLFHPAIQKMKQLIKEGKIGKLQYIYSNRLNLGTVRTEENSLWSFAPHDISIFQYLTEKNPTEISCEGASFLQPHIADTTTTHLRYPENIAGHIFVSWLHPFKEQRLVVIGTKGMFSFEDSSKDKQLLFYQKGIDWVGGEPQKREGPTEIIKYPNSQPLENELNHFVQCITGNEKNNIIDGQKGLEVLSILEKADNSLKEKKHQTIKASNIETEKNYFSHPSSEIDPSAKIGKDTKIWHFSNIQKNAELGQKCILGQSVNIGPNVKVGKSVKIQNNVSIYEGVTLEDYVFCGPSMVFTNIQIPRSKYPQAESKFYTKTLVKEGTSIGANATIVCGTTLGKHSFVGAGAVVTKNIPDYAMVVGNPAKIIGWISEGGQKLSFDENNEAYCSKSNKRYKFENGKVIELKSEKERILL